MPDVLRRGLAAAAQRVAFIELTGKPLEGMVQDCQSYPMARVPLLVLAPIAVAYEAEMAGEGERRNTWRTDRWAPCSRKEAGRWLTFLASLGYQMSAIEQAVARGVPYTGEDMFNTPDADATSTPQAPSGDADPAAAGPGHDDSASHLATADFATGQAASDPAETETDQADDDTGGIGAGEPDVTGEPGDYPGEAVA
jgi:hypothetical protein